jgi:subtilisin family serine protease
MKKSVLALVGVSMVLSTAHANKLQSETPAYVPGELIVKFKSLKNLKSLNGLDIGKHIAKNTALVKFNHKSSIESLILDLNKNDNVEYAEPNYIVHAIKTKDSLWDRLNSVNSNDPKFNKLWGLVNTGNNEPPSPSGGNSSSSGISGADVNALKAWGITKGSKAVRIAIIDTGVDYNHPDLKANMWTNTAEANGTPGVDDDGNGYVDDIHGYDFANKDGDPMDGNGHGTHCAGTIAAVHDNGIGIAGVMAEAEIVGVKFLTDQGSGSSADAIAAIDYSRRIGVDIMSNSWGGGGYSQALKDSIVAANKAGIIFTAAAGNSATDNNTTPHYPSNYEVDNVISVAAHNYNDGLASFSCYGSNTVHVAAPGRNILSTVPNNSYDVYSGTSMATPHVTGVVGLYLAHNGRTDTKDLRDRLMESSVYGPAYGKKTISGGRVDAYNFLAGIVEPRPAKPDPAAWQRTSVDVFESAHPYVNNGNGSITYTVPGAKFLRVVVRQHDLETNYDYLSIKDSNGIEVQRVDGKGTDTVTEYVDGDSITVDFTSDTSVQQWGYIIDEVEFITK